MDDDVLGAVSGGEEKPFWLQKAEEAWEFVYEQFGVDKDKWQQP